VVDVHLLWIIIYYVYMAMDLIFHIEGTDGQGLPVVSAWAWIKNRENLQNRLVFENNLPR
jgi:hypothetical protein